MKTEHQKIVPYLFLAFLTAFLCWMLVARHGMFASKVDWLSQHSVFPEYFRQQFYATGKLIPEFAAGIGAGQNIYNFSYYGLYSPVILPSYLLPFMKMGDYLMMASFLCLTASGMLLYHWLKTCGFSWQICLGSAVLFLLASPVIYHSYRQVMFVNYMPFLILGLIGIERYWKTGRIGLYTAGIFLMIMTSFYFSVAGIFVLLLYDMGRYRKAAWKHPLLHSLLPFPIAICASGILLVPTAYALFSGTRSSGSASQKLTDLFFPDLSLTRFACSGYGIGLTTGIFALLVTGMFYKDIRERFLSLACLAVITIPLFSCLFNGGLYARDKALIPFLPLLCYLTALYLDKQTKKEIPFLADLAGYMMALIWCCASFLMKKKGISTERQLFLIFESGLLLISFLLYRKYRHLMMLVLPSIACLLLFGVKLNGTNGDILEQSRYEKATDDAWRSEISGILAREPGLYRLEQGGSYSEMSDQINRTWNERQWISSVYSSVYQKGYQKFREKIFQAGQPSRNRFVQPASDDPLFQKLMGVKYIVDQEENKNTYTVDVNEHTAPVIYATDKLISRKQYDVLPFPYNQTALMQYAVTDQGGTNGDDRRPNLQTIRQAAVKIPTDDRIKKTDAGYSIKTMQDISSQLTVFDDHAETVQQERLLYLQFTVKNHRKSQDVTVGLNGVRNRLSAKNHLYYNENTTFTYVLRLKAGQTELPILFGKGDYEITDIRHLIGDAQILAEESLYQSHFQPDWEKTKGNRISGRMSVKKTGYLITSIPYERGFSILVDGTHVPVQKVNTAFLGIPISAGIHQIDIVYHAPGLQAGKLLSCIGFTVWAAMLLWRKPRQLSKNP